MKILLAACNAKYIHSNLAVYDLKAYSSDYDKEVFLREYTINQPKDEILKDIYGSGADVVCFSCYIWNISFVRELIRDLAKILPETAFWAGGPEVSYDAEKILTEMPEMTGVLVGEGEKTFHDLLEYYIDGKGSLGEIRGIAYRDGEEIRHNGWRELMNLSEIPFVYQHLEEFENRIIYYESSRGCPFSCSYCLSSIDKKLRFRDLELVKKELQFFLDHKVPQVKFVDRTFNCKHEHAMAIWKYILEHDNGVTNFHFEVSADLLRDEEMDLMAKMRPGLIQLEIGVQSTNQETIRAIHRHMDLDKLERCVDRVHSFRNIHQHLDLIAGLPYEDYDTFHRSFNDVYQMKPDQLQLGFLKVLKGSLMKEEAEKYGIVHKEKEPYEVLSTKWLPYGDVLKLKAVESMVEVYYNSGQFQHTLEYLVPLAKDAFTFYESLGAFYEKKGYSEISHSRMRRYEILLEYLQEETDVSVEKASQKMLYDLYLREKLKKRPSFAPDQKVYETAIWDYRKANHIPKTAHIEVFEDGRAVLFDYERRDPLSNNAYTETIQLTA
ncbi:B12-binding domain-containing radical SAM protein [Blautia glucerasea]|uniref:B12-binding domain-containing radical SAM protein n=1 Tax=Blautia glucerasea TaxID=536633 RepID=UPI001D088D22|nr:B12-binding domain-containing radical SAM protein [Blautia glucerasea]MCB6546500.1 B12-binding domain-containing radical SAM protein [Blautia glucerasea]